MVSLKPRLVQAAVEATDGDSDPTNALDSDPFVALGVIPLEDFDEYVRVFVAGPTGSGKTRLAMSVADIPEMLPCLLFNYDAGTMSVVRRKGIHVVKPNTWIETQRLLVALRNNPGRYNSIAIDDGVEFSRQAMSGVMKDFDNKDIPNRADYLRQQERMRVAIRFFRDYPAHFIMTAKTRDREDSESGGFVTVPGLAGVLAVELPGYFDIVGYLTVGRGKEEESEVVRRFLLVPFKRVNWVKDRTDHTGKRTHIENPTMTTLLKNFRERKTNG